MAMRMMRMTIITTLTVRKIPRAPQRIGASLEGTFGFAGASLGTVGFSPGTASSTPSLVGTGFWPFSGESLTSGLISDGMVLVRSVHEGCNKKKKKVAKISKHYKA